MDTNKVNGVEIPDMNNDNDLYDEISRIPEEDFQSEDVKEFYPYNQSGEEYNLATGMGTNYINGPELDEDQISPEMFDDSEGAWVDAGSEVLDTDPVDNDPFNPEPVTLTTANEITPEEIDIITDEKPEKKKIISINEGLESIGDALSNTTEEELKFDGNYEVTVDDIKKCVGDSTISAPDFDISEESALEIIKLINKIRENKDFVNKTNVYNEFPEEIRRMIDQYLMSNGVMTQLKNNQVRQMKNSVAKSLLAEFSMYIEMNSLEKNFNTEMENIFKDMGTNISSLYKDYNKERDNYLKEILSKIPEENTEKKAIITATMDSIHDSYTLNRLKEAVPKMKKIRKIEMEKPKTRVFTAFEAKYRESPYNMYSLDIALDILNKHNPHEDDPTANLRFLIAFCRYCENYNPNVIPEHSFMFYTVYNIITLDIYKDKDYEEFATDFLKNVNEVIDMIKYDK